MNLDDALTVALSTTPAAGAYRDALITIGEHLGRVVEPPLGAVGVSIGASGRTLLEGVTAAWGSVPTFSAMQHLGHGADRGLTFEWVNGEPPVDLPWVVCDVHVYTGVTVRALLDSLATRASVPAVMVLAVRAKARGRRHILDHYPSVSIVDPTTIVRRPLAERVNGKGHG